VEVRDIEIADPPLQLLIAIPRVTGLADASIQEEINQYLRDIVTRAEQDFARDVARYLDEVGEVEGPISFLDLLYDVRILTPEVLSMRFHQTTFFQGAANPSQSVVTFNVYLTTGEMLSLADLFVGTEWGFALDFLIRDAVISQLYNGDATELEAWVDPDSVLIPEYFALGSAGFEFSFQELEVGPAVVGAPTVTVPYNAIGVYLDPEGVMGGIGVRFELSCEALSAFADGQVQVFTIGDGSTARATALGEMRAAASELSLHRPDLTSVVDVLLGWATAFIDDPTTELTAAEMDAIEASNDVLQAELDLCS